MCGPTIARRRNSWPSKKELAQPAPPTVGLARRDQGNPSEFGDAALWLSLIHRAAAERVQPWVRANVQAPMVEETRQLHEVGFPRHGLRPLDYAAWKAAAKY